MIIDAHLHVFAKLSDEFPREVKPQYPADREATVEQFLALMETHGIDRAVLTQIGGAEPDHHRYLQHCLAAHSDRFLGIGLIPKSIWAAPEAHMDRLAADGRVIGFRLGEIGGPGDPPDDVDVRTLAAYRIWRHAAKKDYVLWLYVNAGDAHLIGFLMAAFPDVRAVFNHLMVCPGAGTFVFDAQGKPRIQTPIPPETRSSTLGLHAYPNVCVKLSGQYAFSQEGWPYTDLADWHRTLLDTFGADRLMWASDFPWIVADPGYDRMLGVIDALLPDLTAKQRAAIMGGTAGRFLRFPERG